VGARTSKTTPQTRRLVLASGSPRRRAMLEEAGIPFVVRPAPIDDGELEPPELAHPGSWVMALAYLKARSVLDACAGSDDLACLVLGADTVCVQGGSIIGQPRDRDHARAIIERMRDSPHEVLTGVASLCASGTVRDLFVDRSVVRVGRIGDDEVARYLDTGLWEGKAGAYNITERITAGWPIEYEGSEDTIVGLPLGRVLERIASMRFDGAA